MEGGAVGNEGSADGRVQDAPDGHTNAPDGHTNTTTTGQTCGEGVGSEMDMGSETAGT